jgi:hypothetical protein
LLCHAAASSASQKTIDAPLLTRPRIYDEVALPPCHIVL